ncbi:MAG: hypothetical protein WCS94_05960 [Verrucomicrobiota bacterium]
MKINQRLLIALAWTLPWASANATIFTASTTINGGDTIYDGQDIVVSNCTLTVSGPHLFTSLLVTSNGVVTHLAAPAGEVANSLNLTIAQDATIETGSRIDVSALGYAAQSGPGQGFGAYYGGTGAGYGGEGGVASGAAGTNYGSIIAPIDFGSGGGNGAYGSGGSGGGSVRLTVGGTLTVAGQILANGVGNGAGYSSGGSGGSVYLTAGTLAGGGAIQANGGNGVAGGAGGRLALYYTASTFTGSSTAFGGAGAAYGGAGTVYLKPAAGTGRVVLDNGGNGGAQTPLVSPLVFHLTITNGASARPQAALNLASLLIASNGVVAYPAGQPGFAVDVQGDATVENGGAVQASCNLAIHGNLLIAGGGNLSANGKGFGADAGPGKGTPEYYHAAGAGYGGPGGRSGVEPGGVYGSLLQPMDLGSGGGSDGVCGGGCPGGAGGGAIRLNVDGTLVVNGRLTANGTDGASGGSGGSLFVSAGSLTGSGIISAAGGATGDTSAGGGGGGRIALYYDSGTFGGTVSAVGGLGGASAYSGGTGTIYTKPNSQAFGALLVDGIGRTNAMETPITSPVPFALILSNATVYPDGALMVGSLLITTNATLTHPAGGSRIQIAVLGDATIAAGAGMDVDGRGYGSDTGPGQGRAFGHQGTGAGYGGPGGAIYASGGNPPIPGGSASGSMTAPIDSGSGGGSAIVFNRPGGAGGGAIQLTVAGTFLVNGRVTANGRDGATAVGTGSGGGSGGSVFLTVGRLAGYGAITANGGAAGWDYAGGGGGGRIAIYSNTNAFIGTTTASGGGPGGGGAGNAGGVGTIYLATNVNVGPLVVAQSPNGTVNRFVSYVDLTFDQPVDPATFTTTNVTVITPAGLMPASQITRSGAGGVTWRVGFPTQLANGSYSIQAAPHVKNLFGQEMATGYNGGFAVNFTNPVVTLSKMGTDLKLIWASATGLNCQLQSTTNLLAASWLNEGKTISGTGEPLTNSFTIDSQSSKFFRYLLLEN